MLRLLAIFVVATSALITAGLPVVSRAQEFWTSERRAAVVAVQSFAKAGDIKPLERGTGFFVSGEGLFVTAEHLVKAAAHVQFSLTGMGGPWADFSQVGARPLGEDLALLKAPERATLY